MQRCVLTSYTQRKCLPQRNQIRSFWEYVNMMFNKPDPDRIKVVGPDRACAEWVLRNGGKITWADGKKLSNYNLLPSENNAVPKILEIDGSDSAISHYGCPHLSTINIYVHLLIEIKQMNLNEISLNFSWLYNVKKIILHNNKYIDDRALKGLSYGRETLTHLQISECCNVTDAGLKELIVLQKLEMLILFNLISVKNIDECKQFIKSMLPDCEVLGNV